MKPSPFTLVLLVLHLLLTIGLLFYTEVLERSLSGLLQIEVSAAQIALVYLILSMFLFLQLKKALPPKA